MEKRSRRRIRDLVARPASLGLSENEIGCARISMMARNTNVPFKGRIQKRKTYHLQIITFRLQRAAGPYRSASFGPPRRSKRRQRCTCSWTTLTALTPRKRRNPEDLRRVPFLMHLPSGQRYGCNWPVQWCRAVAIFPARASRQVRFPLAETRTRGKTLPVRPFGTYDSLICQRAPWMYLSELGWEIPVDFKADAHFDESRSCP